MAENSILLAVYLPAGNLSGEPLLGSPPSVPPEALPPGFSRCQSSAQRPGVLGSGVLVGAQVVSGLLHLLSQPTPPPPCTL